MLPRVLNVAVVSSFTTIATAGQVTTDGSMGAATTLTGPNYTVSQDLGTTVGNNLFHSFGTFNLSQGDVATFTGADTIQNVISRVTDGNPSNIDGTIQSQIGNANFFFINPAGVVFGQNAKVNVPGDFHVSTANELRFADGTKYNLTTPRGSLTAAPPEAFGFLGKTGDIVIEGSQLKFKEGTNVSFTGGSITSNGATIEVPRGSLRVYGQGDTVGTVPLSGDLPKGNGVVKVNGGKWNVNGDGGGNIWISGGAVSVIGNAEIHNDNTGSQDATGAIRIEANTLTLNELGLVTVQTLSSGKGSSIIINTNGAMQVLNGSEISTNTFATGDSGTIVVIVGNLIIGRGTNSATKIASRSSSGKGNAGNVTINVAGEMQVLEGGQVFSATWTSGNAGRVTITAGSLLIDSKGFGLGGGEWGTGIFATTEDSASTGNAGSIILKVTGDMVVLGSRSYVSSSTWYGSGNGGSVNVSVGGLLFLSDGYIATIAHTGHGGDIIIDAPAIVLNNGQITTSVDEAGSYGGDIQINGGYLVLNTGFIQANTAGQGEDAQGGNIFINMDGLLPNGGVTNVGGHTRETFIPNSGRNVIQAAAPNGESGTIAFSNPNDDAASSIGATSNRLEPFQFAKNSCGAFKQGRARFRNKGDKGLPNSGDDVMQFKHNYSETNETFVPHKSREQVCSTK
jgi:filamentous hemagglutinin family protein